jgi:hypothetical protein
MRAAAEHHAKDSRVGEDRAISRESFDFDAWREIAACLDGRVRFLEWRGRDAWSVVARNTAVHLVLPIGTPRVCPMTFNTPGHHDLASGAPHLKDT